MWQFVRQDTRESPWRLGAYWFAAAFLLSLILYALELRCFFISDELSLLASVAPQTGKNWVNCLTPCSNGFLRAPTFLMARGLIDLFGFSPLPFHLACLLIHALAATLTGCLAWRLLGESPRTGWIAVLLFATHLGAYPSAMMLANSCDSMLTVGILGGILAWERWTANGGRAWLAACAACFAFAIVAKESAIIFPALLFLLTLVYGHAPRRRWIALAGFGLAAALYAGVIYTRQSHTPISYLATGTLSFSPKNYCRQLADFSISTIVPFLHVAALPLGGRLNIPHAVLWGLRLLTLTGLVALAVQFLRSPRGRLNHGLALSAAAGLLMPSLYAGKPDARFIYLALPFVCILLASLFIHSRRAVRAALSCGVIILWGLFTLSFFTSETLTSYRSNARDVGRFTHEVIRLAPDWKPGSTIAIFNHPYPNPSEWRWVYCQLIFNIFIPQARATLALDAITPETARAYRFNGRELILVPLRPSNQ
jgi:hypothetical protein